MATNPFAEQMKKDEKAASTGIGEDLTAHLASKPVQSKADSATSSTTSKIPSKVKKVFDDALKKQVAKLKKDKVYGNMDVAYTVGYKMDGASWKATVEASAKYRLKTGGGSTQTLKPGDSAASFAKYHYGDEMYAFVIIDANPGVFDTYGVVLANMPVDIPQIQVVESTPTSFRKLAPAPKSAKGKAEVIYPSVEVDLEKTSDATHLIYTPVWKFEVTVSLKGKIVATKKGSLGKYNAKTHQAEVRKKFGGIVLAAKFNKFDGSEIGVTHEWTGANWSQGWSVTSKGEIKLSFAKKQAVFSFNDKKIDCDGELGMDILIKATPRPRMLPIPKPKTVGDVLLDWAKKNGPELVGIAVGATVGVAAFVITKNPAASGKAGRAAFALSAGAVAAI